MKRGPENRHVLPVTLAPVRLGDYDVEQEAREAAAKIAERRVIRNGRDAWDAIHKSESFINLST